MKHSIQLRFGQHLTMTPQLQQAIRLLQLSTLDLKQEIQEALESNLMLETEEEGALREQPEATEANSEAAGTSQDSNINTEQEINIESEAIPNDLPVDTGWDDVYEPTLPWTGAASGDSSDFMLQQSRSQSLQEYLSWQMNLTPFNDTDRAIAAAIIDGINDDGYLTTRMDDIINEIDDPDIEIEEVEAVLHKIQSFDPPGVAARTPQECLLIQLRQLPENTPHRDPALKLVTDFFDLLAAQNEAGIKRSLNLDAGGVMDVIQLIRSLNPRPGGKISSERTVYVEPDVFILKRNGQWLVELNPEASPRLRVNPEYAGLVRRADNSTDNTTLKNHLQEARWFIKSLHSRNDTLLRVARKIVEIQKDFFEYGEEYMKPLILKEVAEALDMHESTISRVTTQKYMRTPRGTLEFKYFFSSHVSTAGGGEASATAIRALIKKLVSAEPPTKPLSDNKIAAVLADQGIKVARRTVAKYRESMAIPPSNERKRLA